MPNLPPGTPSLVPVTGPITLGQAVALGLLHQPTVGLAQASRAAAAGRYQQARSGLLPSVSFSGGYSRNATSGPSGNVLSTGTNSFDETISARQLIFDFQHTAATVQAARDLEAAARAGEERAREDTAFNIKQAYFTLLEDQRLLGVAEETVAAQRAHLAEARAQFSAGKAAQEDVVKAQTNLAQALLTQSTARNNVALSRTNLNLNMGIDVRTPTQVVDVPASTVSQPPLNTLVTQAQSMRPEVLQAQKQLSASEADLRSARTDNLPSLVATGNLGLRGSSFPGGTNSKGVGVGLSWDVFDSGLTSGRIREAQASLSTARLQLYQAQQTVSTDVTQAYLNVTNAQQQVLTTNAQVANAQETLRQAEGRYRAGVGIFLEVTDAQAALASAQADQVNALYSLNIALAALDRAIGRGV